MPPPHRSPRRVSRAPQLANRRVGSSTPCSTTPSRPAQVSAHFDAAYLATLPAPAATTLNATFEAVAHLQLDKITTSTPESIGFVVTVNGKSEQQVNIAVDAHGLISSLHLQPAGPPPTTTTPRAPTRAAGTGHQANPRRRRLPAAQGHPHASYRGGPFPAVVLVSGSGPNNQDESSGPNRPFLDIATGLAAKGIATLRYDKRTLDYPSSIDPRTFTPTEEYVPDALAAIRLLEHEPAVNADLIFVLGHSPGRDLRPANRQRCPGGCRRGPPRRCRRAARRSHPSPGALPGHAARDNRVAGQG